MARYDYVNERMREQTREKIILTAIALFAEKGFAATSTREIANRCGISVGLMYHYFKNKDEIFDELVKEATEYLNELSTTSIKEIADDCVDEMKKGLEFAQWITIMPCIKNYIDELAKTVGQQKAQYFMAKLKGLCAIQLSLKEDFIVPTAEMLIAGIIKEDKK